MIVSDILTNHFVRVHMPATYYFADIKNGFSKFWIKSFLEYILDSKHLLKQPLHYTKIIIYERGKVNISKFSIWSIIVARKLNKPFKPYMALYYGSFPINLQYIKA